MNKPSILYDAQCVLCNAEIEYYKKKDPKGIFEYIDIMNPRFDSELYGITKRDVHRYFHVVDENGAVLKGVDAFYYIWVSLGRFKVLQKLYQRKVGRAFLELGYTGFVRVRPFLPRRKSCGDYCEY